MIRSLFAAIAIAGCGRPSPSPSPVPVVAADAAPRFGSTDAAPVDAIAADATPPSRPVVVAVTDPAALATVAAAGGSFAALTGAGARSITAVVAADVAAIAAADPRAGVGIRKHSHRLFDVAWLDRGTFELVAVVNRIDRMAETPGVCGDVRLIFRLGYGTADNDAGLSSRLPMTAAVVLRGPPVDGGCAGAARAWRPPASGGGAPGAWLIATGGPLGGGVLSPDRVERVLTNTQAVRWPAGVHPSLGGHTEYLFRELGPRAAGFAPRPLRSVPDVARIRADPALRAALRAWARDPATVASIDRGVLVLPPALRATVSKGFTPRGLARRANRPFRSLIAPRQLAGVSLAGNRIATSPEALLRRMDELTCGGCHQARTIAGFHLLGENRPDVTAGNALASPVSPHLATELERRRAIAEAIAAGGAPDLAPPFAERAPGAIGRRGAACGLGDPGFAAWTCAAGLECKSLDAPTDDDAVGRCVTPNTAGLGEACEIGAVRPGRSAAGDRVPGSTVVGCAAGLVCKENKQGFPLGQCTGTCKPLPDGGACALIAGDGFNACLISSAPFTKCVTDTAAPLGVNACSAALPCRDDYVCVRALDGRAGCLPPYFLFQLRVDGHPRPRGVTP